MGFTMLVKPDTCKKCVYTDGGGVKTSGKYASLKE